MLRFNQFYAFLWLGLSLLMGGKGISQNSTIPANAEDYGSNVVFSAQVSEQYLFDISELIKSPNVQLIFTGTDFDADADEDYTLFDIYINGVQIYNDLEEGTDWGLGEDGEVGEAAIDISDFLKTGSNFIEFVNPESSSETDYVVLETIIIFGEVDGESIYISLNEQSIYLDELTFLDYRVTRNNQILMEFRLDSIGLDSLNFGLLLLNGSFNNLANNDPMLRFFIKNEKYQNPFQFHSVNASKSSFGRNGEVGTTQLLMADYFSFGLNQLVIQLDSTTANTQDALLLRWALLKSKDDKKKVRSNGGIYQLALEEDFSKRDSLFASTSIQYEFYLGSIDLRKRIRLIITGTDVDADLDDDFTEVTIEFNGNEVFEAEIIELGLGANGDRGFGVLELSEYLVEGLNVINIIETEIDGQADFFVIDQVRLEEGVGRPTGLLNQLPIQMMDDKAQKKQAFLVGNARYDHLPSIPNVKQDLQLVEKALKEKGYTVTSCENCTLDQLRTSLVAYLEGLSENALNLIYVAGYGLHLGGRNYILPTDAKIQQPMDVDFACINIQSILAEVSQIKGVKSVFFLDTGYEKTLTQDWPVSSWKTIGRQPSSGQRSLLTFATIPGNSYPIPSEKGGLFAQAFLAALQEGAMPIQSFSQNIRTQVLQASNGQQIPWVLDQLRNPVYMYTPRSSNSN
ncbi:MAG: caspase family protein [Bacteroidota bacterium]